MKDITDKTIRVFEKKLKEEEKSLATVEKYIRDARAFESYTAGAELTKEKTIEYKEHLKRNYAPKSVNSMITSVNRLLEFMDRGDCKVRSVKLQRQIYCLEDRELTRAEYVRLINTAAAR